MGASLKQVTTRQQKEGGHDIPQVSDETNTEHPVENTCIIGVIVDTNSQCELKQLPTKETLPGTSTQIQERNFTQPQEVKEGGRDGKWKHSYGMETGDEVEEMTTDISQQKDPEPSVSGDCKKRDHVHNTQQASKYRTTKDPL